MATSRVARLSSLIGLYALHGAAVGIIQPFLPLFYRGFLSAQQIGQILALGPLCTIAAPPLWGHWADQSGRPDRALRWACAGAALCFLPLLFTGSHLAVLLVAGLFGFFNAAIGPLTDSLTLTRVAQAGGSYARVRVFASMGYVVFAGGLAFLASSSAPRTMLLIPAVLLCLLTVFSLTLHAPGAAFPKKHWADGLRLLRDRQTALLLAACGLHWFAATPYHGMLPLHLPAIGLGLGVVSGAMALGVLSESILMWTYPKFAERISPRSLLCIAFVGSAVRWGLLALTSNPVLVVASSVLHAATYGAFIVAAMALLAQRVPPELRATGQGLFFSLVFGVSGIAGHPLSGALFERWGGHRLFAGAALVEVVAVGLVLQLGREGVAARPALGQPLLWGENESTR